jgi:hypothetical protein
MIVSILAGAVAGMAGLLGLIPSVVAVIATGAALGLGYVSACALDALEARLG